jgi:catechol 2,3-dioxygenase-like lactoylglutathione lyase family enzyme
MQRPPITGVLETVLYCTSENQAEVYRFYSDLLGLRRLGDGSSYRIGPHIFLVFNREESSVQDEPPPHGATGPIHTCFTTPPSDYDSWKSYLAERGVEIIQEIEWSEGVRSFYFEDPAGNLLEIANADMWPR